MDGDKNYIVFLCYGIDSVFHECVYSLLSLSRLYPERDSRNFEVWIYTDKPECFNQYNDCDIVLHFADIDASKIKRWRGNIDFVHRIKIEALIDFTRDKQGNIIYSDTDTVFTAPLDNVFSRIAEGELYMHVMEGCLNDKDNYLFYRLFRLLQKGNFLNAENESLVKRTTLNTVTMWNAGVLGFGKKHADALGIALSFTDELYPKFPKHITEQFAFSLIFQTRGNIKTLEPNVWHYWNFKEVRPVLSSFFKHFEDCTWAELTTYAKILQMHKLMQDKTNFYANRSLGGKIMKKKWSPALQDWELLKKQI